MISADSLLEEFDITLDDVLLFDDDTAELLEELIEELKLL